MRKIVVALCTFIALAAMLAVIPCASGSYVDDQYDLLSSSEKARIEQAFAEAERKCGVRFAVIITEGEYSYTEDDIYRHFGMSYEDDAAYLLVEKFGGIWYYELFLYGKADARLSFGASDDILDAPAVYDNIKSGRLTDGIVAFAELTSESILAAERSTRTAVVIVTVVLALLAAGISIAIVVVRYKRKLKSPIYPISDYANLNLTYATDNFTGSFVTKTRINTSSGGGGKGRSGGGSRGRR